MTYRTILISTAFASATLLSAPAFANHHAESKTDKMHDKAKAAMTSPAAKAPLQQQKAEDLMQKAEKQMDAGMESAAMDTAVEGIKMEMKAEANVDKAEAMTGETLALKTTGETGDPLLGESATVLVNVDPGTVIKPVGAKLMPMSASGTVMSAACPAGTTAQPDNTCMITGDYQK